MKQKYLEAGRIVAPHGVKGDVRVEPWCDDAEFLCGFDTVWIKDKAYDVVRAFPHKSMAVLHLEGVEDRNAAEAMRGAVLLIDREDAELPEGREFVADLVGLDALDDATGEKFGVIAGIEQLPAGDMYLVTVPGRKDPMMIPGNPAFVAERNVAEGWVRFRLMEGL